MEEVHLMRERDPAAKALVFSQVPLGRFSHAILIYAMCLLSSCFCRSCVCM